MSVSARQARLPRRFASSPARRLPSTAAASHRDAQSAQSRSARYLASLPAHHERASMESTMIDHVGFSVSDYARAKAFYEKALAPLGYALVMEATAQETGQPAAGFGSGGKPDFWIGGEGKLEKPVHIAIVAKDRPTVDAFCRAASICQRADLFDAAALRSGGGNNNDGLSIMARVDLAAECRRLREHRARAGHPRH